MTTEAAIDPAGASQRHHPELNVSGLSGVEQAKKRQSNHQSKDARKEE